jgi:hypothetical protein
VAAAGTLEERSGKEIMDRQLIAIREQEEKRRSGGPAANKTLRDEIAIAAMQGLCCGFADLGPGSHISPDGMAESAYKLADAMIEESRK